jgi:hypothetical protein
VALTLIKRAICLFGIPTAVIHGATLPTKTDVISFDQSQEVLLDSFSPNTFSLQLLQVKDKFNSPSIVLGGSAQFDAQHWWGNEIEEYPVGKTYEQGNGIYFTQTTLDIMTNVNSWITTFLAGSDSYIGRGDPGTNYTYVPHAFVALGNLDKFPTYSTLGINTIPFGVFSGSGPWDTPLTAAYFNPAQAPQISIGYNKNGLNAVATGFKDQTNYDINYAYSVYYNKSMQNFSYSIGAGYLTDLKIDNTSSSSIPKNTQQKSSPDLGNLGAIIDINGSIIYRQIMLTGEYDKGKNQLSGNDSKPAAYAITGNYTKMIAGQNTTFGISHSLALHLKDVPTPLPGYDTLVSALYGIKATWSLNVSRPIFKNTFLGLDLQRATVNPGAHTSTSHSYTSTVDLTTYL